MRSDNSLHLEQGPSSSPPPRPSPPLGQHPVGPVGKLSMASDRSHSCARVTTCWLSRGAASRVFRVESTGRNSTGSESESEQECAKRGKKKKRKKTRVVGALAKKAAGPGPRALEKACWRSDWPGLVSMGQARPIESPQLMQKHAQRCSLSVSLSLSRWGVCGRETRPAAGRRQSIARKDEQTRKRAPARASLAGQKTCERPRRQRRPANARTRLAIGWPAPFPSCHPPAIPQGTAFSKQGQKSSTRHAAWKSSHGCSSTLARRRRPSSPLAAHRAR